MHERLIERLESQDYFGFTYFARSNAYSTIFIQLLGLSVVGSSEDSIVSISGIQKLD
jgi:hypothetical protein